MPLTPALHALHEYMFLLGYGQGALADNAITQDYPLNPSLPTPSPTAMLTPMHPSLSTPSPTATLTLMHPPFSQGIDPRCFLPTPVSTPTSLHSHSVASETSVAADSGMTREKLPVTSTAHWRPRCNAEEGSPPGPGFDPNLPCVANANPDDCNRGARRLRIHRARVAARALAMKDVLRPGEEEEEWEADGEEVGVDQMGAEEVGEVHEHDAGDSEQAVSGPQTQRRGAWRRRPLDDPRISCSDQATTIIAELAAAHCLSSIHDPLRWLQDIGNFVQVPSVDNESLLSLVVRCRGMMGKDIHINFMIMINFMTLVCKCQSIRLKTGLHLKGIYENEVKDRPSETKVTYRTFLEWHATGSKFIPITCGGSIYALVLIAGLGLRVSIASMVGTTH
ncbi:hypothetical protein BDR06DRAFT_1014974 [Suillus hirtellus]|nr:hypothetical protein BDR06DRAFT_1014974 [Suillus hirtellus]